MPGDITGSMVIDSRTRRARASARARSSPTCCSPTRSTGRRPRPSRRCSRRWRRARSRSTASRARCRGPFLVAATQNPVEYEGTYPLPEAQLDRFLLKVVLPIPERDAELEILRRHAAGFDPRDVAGAGVTAGGRPGRHRGRPGRRQAGPGLPRGGGLHRRHRPRHPGVAVAEPRRQPARRDRAAARGAGVGLAHRPRLRDPRRREGARPRHARAPARAAARGRARGRRRRPRCSPPRSARSRSPADSMAISGGSRCWSCWGWCRSCCARPSSTMWLWLLVVPLVVAVDLLLAPSPPGLDDHSGADRPAVRLGYPAESELLVAQLAGRGGSARACAMPGSRRPARPTTGTGSTCRPGDRTLLRDPAAAPPPRRPARDRRHRACSRPAGAGRRGSAPSTSRGWSGRCRPSSPASTCPPAGPAARARRPRRGPGPRAGHRVRLAARVRPRRRRPLDRLAGQRPQPRRRRPHLAARARPAGRARARHLAHLGRPGRRRAAAGLGDGRRPAAGGAGHPGRRPGRLRRRRPAGALAAALGRRPRRGGDPPGHHGRPRAGDRRGRLVGAGRGGHRRSAGSARSSYC